MSLGGDDVRLEMIAAAAQAGRDAAAQALPVPIPGVVVSVDPTNTIAMVQADGPEGDVTAGPHGAAVVAPVTLVPGDRVMLLYTGTAPGCLVLGRRSGDWDEWHTVGDIDEPPFIGTWAAAAGTTFPGQNGPAAPMFTMRSGRVELRGRAHRASGALNNIYTLPEPYWPDNDLLISCIGVLGSNTSFTIDMSTGIVASTGGADIILDGVSYLARIQQIGD